MVEKRTLVFITLAVILWAATASSFAAYYFLQWRNYGQQLDESQTSLNKSALDYDEAVRKFNLLSGEYSVLHGDYSFVGDGDYDKLLEPFGQLVANLSENYADLLTTQRDLNRTYFELSDHCETLGQRGNVTREEFGSLLCRYLELFYALTLKELTQSISETITLSVNMCVDYGNETVWLNDTRMSPGSTLFEFTQKIASVNYTYYSLMEPGHIMIDSINETAKHVDPSFTWGYSWIWYYWDEAGEKWIVGPVGCDAWLLKDEGVYKWHYERWSWP